MNLIPWSQTFAARPSRRDPTPPAGARRIDGVGTRQAIVRRVTLDRGNVLRIQDGPGTRVVAASGVLWVTEEDNPQDHTLLPGDALRLAHRGKAIVFAHRRARVVLEVPAGVAAPREIEFARADAKPGRRIVLARGTAPAMSEIAAGVASTLRNATAWLAASIRRLAAQ